MEIFFEPCSPVVHMPAHRPRPWLMSLEMYNDLAPWFGHTPIPSAPKFPTADKLFNKHTNSKQMTEQSLIEYAKKGDQVAIAHLSGAGYDGMDWVYAITHVNGGWLSGDEIKRVYGEMKKIHEETAMPMGQIRDQLQAALNAHHLPKMKPANLGFMSPADRPWNFKKRGRGGSNYTPPKKKRKK